MSVPQWKSEWEPADPLHGTRGWHWPRRFNVWFALGLAVVALIFAPIAINLLRDKQEKIYDELYPGRRHLANEGGTNKR